MPGEFAVDDRHAQRAFGGLLVGCTPGWVVKVERGPDLDEVVGGASVSAGARALAAGVLK
jgi:hypothetical protein